MFNATRMDFKTPTSTTNDMPTTDTFLLIGAGGKLGKRIARHLLSNYKYNLRVLVRECGDDIVKELGDLGAHLFVVDFELSQPQLDHASQTFLAEVMKGVTVCISAVHCEDPEKQYHLQRNLITAAKQAKVKRFVPSDFSMNYFNLRLGEHYDLDSKIRTYMDLKNSKDELEYTSIICGSYMEELLSPEMGIIDVDKQYVTYFGEGTELFDVVSIDDVAIFTVECLVRWFNATANQVIHFTCQDITMFQLAQILSEETNRTFEPISRGDISQLNQFINQLKLENNKDFVQYQSLKLMVTQEGKLDNEKAQYWKNKFEQEVKKMNSIRHVIKQSKDILTPL
ncbi:hypothetical protein ABK040_002343 [Willaertia magna]